MSKQLMGLIAGGLFLMIIALGIGFTTQTFAAIDTGTNMTDSPFEDQYNSSIDTGKSALSFLGIVPYLVAITIIIMAVIGMFKLTQM